MKPVRYLFFSFLGLGLTFLLQSCTLSGSGDFTSPGNPANLLSASATIGTSTAFDTPSGIQYWQGYLWLANWSTCLQKWPLSGPAPVTTIWTYNSGVSFTECNGTGIDPATGNVYCVDESHEKVVVFDQSANYLTQFGYSEMTSGSGTDPIGVAVNSAGTTVYVLGLNSQSVLVYSIGGTPVSPTYTYRSSFGDSGPASARLKYPYNLRVDGGGNIWIADTQNNRVAEYDPSGTFKTSFTDPQIKTTFLPSDLLVDNSGNVYAVSPDHALVVKFNPTGSVVGYFGIGVLSSPSGIATDGAGTFYVSEDSPEQIVVFH